MVPGKSPINAALDTLRAHQYDVGAVGHLDGVLHVLINRQWRTYDEIYALADRVTPSEPIPA